MNVFLLLLVLGSVISGLISGKIDLLSGAMVQAARGAVELALGLVGGLSLWLGLLAILDKGGLMKSLSHLLLPLFRRIFPDVPANHPALGAMVMNFAANVLGMDNAATAFGLKAMRALDTLNAVPGVATNAMVLFLAINTAGIQAVPFNVIAARAAIEPATAGVIMVPTIMVSILAATAAIGWATLFSKLPRFARSKPATETTTGTEPGAGTALAPGLQPTPAQRLGAYALSLVLAGAFIYRLVVAYQPDTGVTGLLRSASGWFLVILAAIVLLYGLARGVKLYETAVAGAREGFDVAVRIMPYLVIILVGVGLFRTSGLMDVLVSVLSPITTRLGMPAEVLPQALIRPLSGSAAMGLLVDTLKTHGPSSEVGYMSSVIYGSSETTFYVLAVYFGAVGVKSLRHALWACLCADVTGVLLAVWIARWFH